MNKLGNYFYAASGLILLAGAMTLIGVRPVKSTTPATDVFVTNGPTKPDHVEVDNAETAYQAIIYVNIANGASGGGDNGNVSPGSQTLLIPTGKRLVVQSVSVYRSGAISSGNVQIFINSDVNGGYAARALPVVGPTTALYAGSTLSAPFYADGGTELLANAFRDSTTGAETETVSVTGYLINH
jgi:hypothetical protein